MANSNEFSAAKTAYANDGSPETSMLLNDEGLRICLYKWKVNEKPKGIVLLVHGVTSHARFEYLYHPQCKEMDEMWAKKKGDVLSAMKGQRKPLDEEESLSSEDGDNCENEAPSDESNVLRTQSTNLTKELHINPAGSDGKANLVEGVPLGKGEVPQLNSRGYRVVYEGSWIEQLNKQNLLVYAVDLQSHGLSDGWNGERCSVERFDNFATDVLTVLTRIRTDYPISTNIPLFMMGISMGGLVLVRALEIGSKNGQFGTDNKYLTGCVLLAPALSVATIKAKPSNKLAMPLGKFLSKALPSARVAAKQPNLRFYHIEQLCSLDPLIYKKKMRARLSMELVERMETAHDEAKVINPNIAILICHSHHDTMCDPEGSTTLMEELPVSDKQLWMLDDLWHFLTKEPGTQQLLSNITGWIDQHIQ